MKQSLQRHARVARGGGGRDPLATRDATGGRGLGRGVTRACRWVDLMGWSRHSENIAPQARNVFVLRAFSAFNLRISVISHFNAFGPDKPGSEYRYSVRKWLHRL